MKKGKKIVISVLVFLITSVFYREITLKKFEAKEDSTVESTNLLENRDIIIVAEAKVTEDLNEKNIEVENFDPKNYAKEELEITEEEVLALGIIEKNEDLNLLNEDKELESQIAKEWEEQEERELFALDEEIDLEEKITLENLEYTIKKGDTIYDLSKEYKIKADYIYANNVEQNLRVLQIGKKIKIPTESGIFYAIKKGDTFDSISKRFEVDVKIIKEDNEIDKLLIGTKIFLREPKVSKYLNSFRQEYVKKTNIGTFANPLLAMSVTSSFGNRNHPVLKKVLSHGGVDLKAKTGTRVMSARSGTVSFAGNASGYGKLIIIKHDNGYETRYAHLSKINVKKGQKVSQKELIGLSGATGRVTGPHLHFEIRKNGKIENPLVYLKF